MAPVSEKKKITNARWDKNNMATLACKVRKEQAEAFKEYAANQGKTANTVLKDFVESCIDEDKERDNGE